MFTVWTVKYMQVRLSLKHNFAVSATHTFSELKTESNSVSAIAPWRTFWLRYLYVSDTGF